MKTHQLLYMLALTTLLSTAVGFQVAADPIADAIGILGDASLQKLAKENLQREDAAELAAANAKKAIQELEEIKKMSPAVLAWAGKSKSKLVEVAALKAQRAQTAADAAELTAAETQKKIKAYLSREAQIKRQEDSTREKAMQLWIDGYKIPSGPS